MKYQKETLFFSMMLSVTSVVFLMISIIKSALPFSAIDVLVHAIIYFALGFIGCWVGQLLAGNKMAFKPLFWVAPLAFILPHQISKFTGLYEAMPLVHFLLVAAAACIIGWRFALSPANEFNPNQNS